MFIVFEGIDNSGKSTLSKKFVEYLNSEEAREIVSDYCNDTDDKLIAACGDFKWTKEPQFTTEEADQLNSEEFKDEYKREALFFSDRYRHQKMLSEGFVVCDRYIWTGLAYAKKFAPNSFELVKHLYTDESIFMAPDLYIFVDTPVEICDQRDPSVGLKRLESLRQAYIDTSYLIPESTKVIVTRAGGSVEESLNLLKLKFTTWARNKYAKYHDISWE